METFCGSVFWDNQITWNTTNPYFTPCFEDTVVTWIAPLFLITFVIVDIRKGLIIRKCYKKVGLYWNMLSSFKCILLLTLISTSAIQLCLLYLNFRHAGTPNLVDIVAVSVKLLSYCVSLAIFIFSKSYGIRSSGVQSIFWFLASLTEAVLFRTAVARYTSSSGKLGTAYIFRFITFPLVWVSFILQFWTDSFKEDSKHTMESGKPCPEKVSSFFCKIFITWYDKIAWKCYHNPLNIEDLWDLNEEDTSKSQSSSFDKHWSQNKGNAAKYGGKSGIVTTLFHTYRQTFLLGGILKFSTDLLGFVPPEMLKCLLAFVANSTEEYWKGFLYAGVLFVTAFLQAVINTQYNRRMLLLGMRIRTALSNAVYRKSLYLSNFVKTNSNVGEIVNLMSVDTQHFMDLMPFIHMIWTAPLKIIVSTYFLYNLLGASVFAGLGVILLLIPVNWIVARKLRTLQMEQMKIKDSRVTLMSEIISGIKILKLYAWETSFEDQIKLMRTNEIKLLRKIVFLNTSSVFAFTCAPFLVSVATFATFVHTDSRNILSPEVAFVSIALFNIMRIPLMMFPTVVALTAQTMVSATRLNKYLNSEETDRLSVLHYPNPRDAILIENGYFGWDHSFDVLRSINLRVKRGSLVAIVGSVGSGKSTLLHAILGGLYKKQGRVNTTGTVAYVAQNAWIQSGTLKENILFGDLLDDSKYKKIIQSCALVADFKSFPAGDKTEIGERGLNLSGGQKQRVALARAAYKDSDIYLFDDPLSAVDSHVGKHIWSNLIGPTGLLKTKTRLLVTHGISYLSKVDLILVVKDGSINEIGTYKDLLQRKDEFPKYFLNHLSKSHSDCIFEDITQDSAEVVTNEEVTRNSSIDLNLLPGHSSTSEFNGTDECMSQLNLKNEQIQLDKSENLNKKLVQVEIVEKGRINLRLYLEYIKGCGLKAFTFAISLLIVSQMFQSYGSIWLSDWSDQIPPDGNTTGSGYDSTNKYLGGYAGIGLAQALTVLGGGIVLGLGCLKVGSDMHENMLTKVMRAPMYFFDTTPAGRLVNRFAKDVDTADNIIPMNLRSSINILLNALATIVVISYATPLFLFFIIPTSSVYFFLWRFYIASSCHLRRLESVSRSPIYSKFAETISGVTTIRAFAFENEFIISARQKFDYNAKTYFPFIASTLWVSVRLEVLGALIILASAIFVINGRHSISPGTAGLSISYALQITQLLSFLIKTLSDLEISTVALERMKETTRSPQEAGWVGDMRPPKGWPMNGHIEFKGYKTRYREGLNQVLRGITCSFKAGEKIGIVGRTGAGKSSLTLALFRLVEPVDGFIFIDGEDVTTLGLHDLRSKITIIPQDPVLFSGTLRANIDPFKCHTDDELWNCLELAHLKTFVESLHGGLYEFVAEEGQNFSVGQRQLICLARALLRKTKILVLDEATAAVDLEIENKIHDTIKEEFKQSTVVIIAHRLNTIMDCARVLVLENGTIKEFDTPAGLLGNNKSVFFKMVEDAGIFPTSA